MSVHSLRVSVLPFQSYEMGDTDTEAVSALEKNHNMNGPTLWHGSEQHIINITTDEWCKHL